MTAPVPEQPIPDDVSDWAPDEFARLTRKHGHNGPENRIIRPVAPLGEPLSHEQINDGDIRYVKGVDSREGLRVKWRRQRTELPGRPAKWTV